MYYTPLSTLIVVSLFLPCSCIFVYMCGSTLITASLLIHCQPVILDTSVVSLLTRGVPNSLLHLCWHTWVCPHCDILVNMPWSSFMAAFLSTCRFFFFYFCIFVKMGWSSLIVASLLIHWLPLILSHPYWYTGFLSHYHILIDTQASSFIVTSLLIYRFPLSLSHPC